MEQNICPACGSDQLDMVIEESGCVEIFLCTECGCEIPAETMQMPDL